MAVEPSRAVRAVPEDDRSGLWHLVPDKRVKNSDVVVAGIGFTGLMLIRYQGWIRRAKFDGPPFLSSSSRSVLRPDTSLILECVRNSKSNDLNKSVPVISLFIRARAGRDFQRQR